MRQAASCEAFLTPGPARSWAALFEGIVARGYLPAMLKLLTEVCSIPTAPFAEQYVVRYVEKFVAARRGLKLSRDQAGNLLIEARQKPRRRGPRWVFAAHMDHPGFVARRRIDAKTLEADFRGWVRIDYVRGTRVRFFEADGREITGVVTEATSTRHDRLTVPDKVRVRVSSAVSRGCPGMFDQGAGRVRGNKFHSRGVDDQGGMASALAIPSTCGPSPRSHEGGGGSVRTRLVTSWPSAIRTSLPRTFSSSSTSAMTLRMICPVMSW